MMAVSDLLHHQTPSLTLSRGPARTVEYPVGSTFGPRILDDWELLWIIHGGALWHANGHRLELHPGDVGLAAPGTADRFEWDTERTTRHGYLHFVAPTDWRRVSMGSGSGATTPHIRHVTKEDPVWSLLTYLLWLAGTPDGERWTIQVLQLLLGLVAEAPIPSEARHRRLSTVTTASLLWLQREWEANGVGPVTLPVLAHAAGVSAAHLCRSFRRDLDLTPVAAVDRIRIKRAADLLVRTDLTVGSIGQAVGFADPYAFSRRFKAVFGESPRSYRASQLPRPTSPVNEDAILRAELAMGSIDDFI